MKYIQIADVHFDIPFTTLTERSDLGQMRRMDQRKAFKKVIDYAKDNQIDYLFICGDLYEQEYIRKSTIEYINDLFKTIPQTKILITPGNHDPLTKYSYYAAYEFASNVKIFTEKPEKIEDGDLNIYGYGFNDFAMNKQQYKKIKDVDESKINIFISHGDLFGSKQYNPIDLKDINLEKMDLVLMGHIHKRDEFYCGSLISLGFDEPGEHGFIVGEIYKNGEKIISNKKFVRADDKEFVEKNIDISQFDSVDTIIEKINELPGEALYKVNLLGTRSFPIEIKYDLLNKNIIKVKDKTSLKDDKRLKENDKTLRGIFMKKMNQKLKNGEISKEDYEQIVEVVITALGK